MSSLLKIKSNTQQVADAISAALNICVEITDNNLECIAGTGTFKNFIGSTLKGYIHSRVLSSGKTYTIENPGYHSLCKPCIRLKNCYATGEICVPINSNKEIVGVIGLVSLNEEQKKQLFTNTTNNIYFLNKMADLISTKLKENELMNNQNYLNSHLTTIINSIDLGIIATDEYGIITHANNYALNSLGVDNITGKRLVEILPISIIKNLFISNSYFKNEEIVLKFNKQNIRIIGNAYPAFVGVKKIGLVFSFRLVSDAIKTSLNVTSPLKYSFDDIIGNSKEIIEVKKKALRIAKSTSTVLIQGESGTGKEILARAIHNNSNRAHENFVTINCGAIPETLLESELFGYEEGAFTGAKKSGKMGKFEIANGGTIFLDEIGDMPLHMQVKLLRVLQEKTIERVGGTFSVPIDVRIIAATNKNLEELAKQNLFRWDLFYRLNVIPIVIPPLRDRKEDIILLSNYFLQLYNAKIGKNIRELSKEAELLIKNYTWPGNVRELANAIEYAVNMETSATITPKNLPSKLKDHQTYPPIMSKQCNDIKIMERELICNALAKYGKTTEGKIKAAEQLGISLPTLYRKIKIYNIS